MRASKRSVACSASAPSKRMRVFEESSTSTAAGYFGAAASVNGRNDTAAALRAGTCFRRARHHWKVDNAQLRFAQYAFCVWPDPAHCAMRFTHRVRPATLEFAVLPAVAMVRFLIDKEACTLAGSPRAEKNGDYRTRTKQLSLRRHTAQPERAKRSPVNSAGL